MQRFKPSLGQGVFIPGSEVDRRALRWFGASGEREDKGLDGVSVNICSDLFARIMDQDVMYFLFKVLSIK
jgi:hypothetical protein